MLKYFWDMPFQSRLGNDVTEASAAHTLALYQHHLIVHDKAEQSTNELPEGTPCQYPTRPQCIVHCPVSVRSKILERASRYQTIFSGWPIRFLSITGSHGL